MSYNEDNGIEEVEYEQLPLRDALIDEIKEHIGAALRAFDTLDPDLIGPSTQLKGGLRAAWWAVQRLRVPAEPPPGAILSFELRFKTPRGDSSRYGYAARKADGKWWVTGTASGGYEGRPWDSLVEWIRAAAWHSPIQWVVIGDTPPRVGTTDV